MLLFLISKLYTQSILVSHSYPTPEVQPPSLLCIIHQNKQFCFQGHQADSKNSVTNIPTLS